MTALTISLKTPTAIIERITRIKPIWLVGTVTCLLITTLAITLFRPSTTPTVPDTVRLSFFEAPDTITPETKGVPKQTPNTLILTVKRGNTFSDMLRDKGFSYEQTQKVMRALKPIYNPARLFVGQTITITYGQAISDQGEAERMLTSLSIKENVEKSYLVTRNGAEFEAKTVYAPLVKKQLRRQAVIDSSLYAAAMEVGIPENLLMELITAYSYDVDFQRDIRKGDALDVFYDHLYLEDGTSVKGGDILYANLTLQGEDIPIYLYHSLAVIKNIIPPKGKPYARRFLKHPSMVRVSLQPMAIADIRCWATASSTKALTLQPHVVPLFMHLAVV